MTRPRGLRDYDHGHLHDLGKLIAENEALMARDPESAARIDREIAAGKAPIPRSSSIPRARPGAPRAWCCRGARCIAAARDTVAFDKLTDRDVVLAYLPLAWVGDHYLNYAQSLVAGFCMACPESQDTAQQDLREIGPTFYFAPPRVFENLLTRVMIRMEDAGFLKRRMFHYFIGVARRYGEKILDKQPVPIGGRLLYWLGEILVYGPTKNVLGFSRVRIAYTAGEAIGPELFSFYRSLGLNLKQLYGQTEAFLYVTCQPDREIHPDTVGTRGAQCRHPHLGYRRGDVQVARHVPRLFQGSREDRRSDDAGRLREDRRCRLLRPRPGI